MAVSLGEGRTSRRLSSHGIPELSACPLGPLWVTGVSLPLCPAYILTLVTDILEKDVGVIPVTR